MNIIKAKEILQNLKDQLKTLEDQAMLYRGSVQGAELILAELEQEEVVIEEPIAEVDNIPVKTSRKK